MAAATTTPVSTFELQRAAFQKNPFPPAKLRRQHLKALRQTLLRHQDDVARAISRDFGGRSRIEVLYSEIFVSVNALRHAERNVGDWMQPRRVELDWPLQPASAYVLPQPAGIVGVISPWNYPIFLTFSPLASALAAGNRVLLKPSEFTPETSALLEQMLGEVFPPDHVGVVQGGADVGIAFSGLPFDHLLFTGSTEVGRKVMQAAAANLTPVTLELGGKSPALIASDARLARAADDIVYGKFLNAGQTCIAPDYVLIPRGLRDQFVELLRRAAEKRFPSAASNPDYTSIINDRQYSRLDGYLREAAARGAGIIELCGSSDAAHKRLAPRLVVDPPDDLRLMQEEIFGPILPVRSYDSMEDAIGYINARPRPLAMYLFSSSDRLIDDVLRRTVAGGVSVNDTLLHIAADELPFGGSGASGIGHYHGRAGFETFSKMKPVFHRHGVGLGVSLRPPYGKLQEWMRRILIR
jgi:coniferyl-aldehyde dehydrogenase